MDKFMADRMGLADVNWGTGVGAVLVGGLGLLLVFQILLEVTQTIRYWHVPGPGGRLPVLGHALDLMKGNMWETLGKWGDQYGSIYKIFIMGKVVIIVTDTAHIKQMMQTNIKNYEKDQFCYSAFDCLLGNGIVLSEGERWYRNSPRTPSSTLRPFAGSSAAVRCGVLLGQTP
jgi:hypothetical protein